MADPALHAIKTYRYLRLAMAVLVAGLAASLVTEWREVGYDCLQTSISAYYYTPVRAFFVSALLAIGVCLVVLKGNNDLEDALLNVAGMLAPVVALVPTPGEGSCSSAPGAAEDAGASIFNNMVALFALGLLGLLVTAVLLAQESRADGRRSTRASWWGLAGSTVLWLAAVLFFVNQREVFDDNAHYAAAIVMFLCIVAVVVLNAVGFGREMQVRGQAEGGRAYVNRYLTVAVAMGVGVVGMLLWAWLVGWDHLVFGIEALLIGLFAAFWVVQTSELWGRGLRGEEDVEACAPASPDRRPASPAGGGGER